MITLPEQPWQKDDTFTVEETGVRYVYDGEKWLSEAGEEVDLTGYATEEWVSEQIDAIEIPDADLTPVEERLDSIEEVLPKVPLVIDPVDLGRTNVLIDYPQRPSGTQSPPAGECWMWHMDAGRTGNPANEMKVVVTADAVSNIILDGTTEVWFKQGDRVQKWNCNNGGWFTAGNLWHISAQSTEGDDLVDGQPFELFYLDPNATGDDLLEVISRMESKADDRKLQAEIEVLSGQLSTLVKSQEDGEWTYKGELPEVPRNAGEFILATSTLTSEINSVYLQETDLGGITHNFDAPVGSYIEIVDIDDPLDYVLFEVTDEPQGTGLIQIDCKMVKAGNAFEIDDRCIIRFFQVTEGLDINELDARYLQLTGGVMKGRLGFKGNQWITYIDGNDQQYIQFKMGTSTSYTGGYNADDHIATKKRVDEAFAETVKKAERNEIAEGQFQMVWIDDSPDLPFQGRIGYQSGVTDPNGMEGSFLFADGINEKTGNTAILSIGRDGDLELHGDNAIRGIGHGSGNWRPIIEGFYSIEAEKIIINGEELTDPDLSDYVSKTGGDFMEGPLHVKGWGDDSRGTSRVKTLGVFSESASALRLGTTTDRVYIEDENTKFNGGIMVNNIGPKTEDGRGVTLNVEGSSDNHLVTKKYVDDRVVSSSGGALVSTSFRCMWKSGSSTDGYTFYTQQENGTAVSSHQGTKFINIRLPSDFWTVKAGVVPAGRDTGYITVIDPATGQIVYSGQAITVSSGGTTFKVDCNRDLYTNNPTYWTADKNYLIRMESCFREA